MKRDINELDNVSLESKKQNTAVTTNREVSTVLVRNLPRNYNNYKLKKYFQQCGEIKQVDMIFTKEKDAKVARIEFVSFDGALSALTKSLKVIGSNKIIVEHLRNSTIWITNFPPTFQVPELRNLFASLDGYCLSVRLPSLRFNSNRRFAYIDMDTNEHAVNAVEMLHQKVIEGYKLIVKLSNPNEKSARTDAATMECREIYIRHLDNKLVTLEKLTELVMPFGPIERINMPCNGSISKDVHNNGYAFVAYKSAADSTKALQLNNSTFEGKIIKVSIADRKAYLERQRVKELLNTMNFHSNIISIFPLSDKISKAQIKSMLKENSSFLNDDLIKEIFLVSDHQGALIVFEDDKTAAKVTLALNGCKIGDQILKCGSIQDLIRSKQLMEANNTKHIVRLPVVRTESTVKSSKKLTNEDFRKMLFQR
ncbi:HGR071Cp [Eremothecium sinecaudum]|uniref:HGR071Cp n=1 Tax=Eremothecium sinecaudum TaxID=45286 RepID=A0A120K2S0_9SACH|nr:HGR071Cp [Eremothecium sinecaudum]AMD22410.1 HGR071Cp [Eremothecium sinecaudum]